MVCSLLNDLLVIFVLHQFPSFDWKYFKLKMLWDTTLKKIKISSDFKCVWVKLLLEWTMLVRVWDQYKNILLSFFLNRCWLSKIRALKFSMQTPTVWFFFLVMLILVLFPFIFLMINFKPRCCAKNWDSSSLKKNGVIRMEY